MSQLGKMLELIKLKQPLADPFFVWLDDCIVCKAVK